MSYSPMLLALTIRDFAIIDALELELGAGLTVITGETGAGKSILINALALVLGARARTEIVRTGCEFALVEALFDLRSAPTVKARMADAGLDAGDELVVRRVVSISGRHRVYLNGALATVSMLAQITRDLVDISGQAAHYSLLRPETHLELLDQMGGLGAQREKVTTSHQEVAALDAQLEAARQRNHERVERGEFLRFQLQTLSEAKLDDPDEEVALTREASRLRNAERLRSAAMAVEGLLYEHAGAAAEQMGTAVGELETLVDLEPGLGQTLEDLRSALAIVEDAARTAGDYGRQFRADPARLEAVEQRLSVFAKLRRKYGTSLVEVIEHQRALQAELAALDSAESDLDTLGVARAEVAARLGVEASTLTAARRAASVEFVEVVTAELSDLAMVGAQLMVDVRPLAGGVEVPGGFVGTKGADRVEVRFSANPGEVPQALNRIASGGELSRFMLAVKRVIAARDPVSTYIFDEVDAGIGGVAAEAIGRKLHAVGEQRQAICITHLAQIAAMGHHHFKVEKRVEGDRTRSTLTALDEDGRVAELARMMGGATLTEATRAHAQELLELSSTV